MRTGMVLGILGGLAGLGASVLAFFVYMVEGLNGTGNPLAPRLGFLVAAFILALVVVFGGILAPRRPEPASVLMVGGSVIGTIAISLFYLNTWYALAVPLCLLAAALALNGAGSGAGAVSLRALVLILIVAAAIGSYWIAGLLGVVVFAALFVLVGALQMARPAWIP